VKQKKKFRCGLSALTTAVLMSLSQLAAAHLVNHQQLIDACTSINHDYALARDHADREAYADLFTSDAEFIMQGETFAGIERILERIGPGNSQRFARLLVTTVDISPIDTTTATGITYFIMYMAMESGEPGLPITSFQTFMGEYHDEYKLTADGCKFTRRETKPLFIGETS
jgi:hypothetical protein